MTADLLDTRGMRCPWPALRLARAMRQARPGEQLRLISDDPKAESEIASLAAAQDWQLIIEKSKLGYIFIVSR